jgi:hypothetical protein
LLWTVAAAVAFFKEVGLEVEGESQVEGRSVDRLIALDGVRADEDIDDVVARLRAHGAFV